MRSQALAMPKSSSCCPRVGGANARPCRPDRSRRGIAREPGHLVSENGAATIRDFANREIGVPRDEQRMPLGKARREGFFSRAHALRRFAGTGSEQR